MTKKGGKDDIKWYGRIGHVSTHHPSTWTSSPWNLLVHSCIRRSPPCKGPPHSVGHFHKKYKLRPQQTVACELIMFFGNFAKGFYTSPELRPSQNVSQDFHELMYLHRRDKVVSKRNSGSGPSGLPKYRTCHAWERTSKIYALQWTSDHNTWMFAPLLGKKIKKDVMEMTRDIEAKEGQHLQRINSCFWLLDPWNCSKFLWQWPVKWGFAFRWNRNECPLTKELKDGTPANALLPRHAWLATSTEILPCLARP